jgi:hypothetical protein
MAAGVLNAAITAGFKLEPISKSLEED